MTDVSCAVLLFGYHVIKLPFSRLVSDGESPLQKYPRKRKGDADLLHLHGEEQQEPPGPERGRWRQTAGLKAPDVPAAVIQQ